MRTEDPEIYNLSRILVLYAVDIMSMLPPFILIMTCMDVREPILDFFRRKLPNGSADNSRTNVVAFY